MQKAIKRLSRSLACESLDLWLQQLPKNWRCLWVFINHFQGPVPALASLLDLSNLIPQWKKSAVLGGVRPMTFGQSRSHAAKVTEFIPDPCLPRWVKKHTGSSLVHPSLVISKPLQPFGTKEHKDYGNMSLPENISLSWGDLAPG